MPNTYMKKYCMFSENSNGTPFWVCAALWLALAMFITADSITVFAYSMFGTLSNLDSAFLKSKCEVAEISRNSYASLIEAVIGIAIL